MKKTTTIVVISTPILGRTNYVASEISTRTYDNRKLVDHTSDPKLARDFGTLTAARSFIKTMVNPHDRKYTAEQVTIASESKAKKITGPVPAEKFS